MQLSKRSPKKTSKKFTPVQVLIKPDKPCIRVYTDGSCLVNPGGAGTCSFVIVENDKPIHQHGEHYQSTTNNRMEIRAVINAIEYISGIKWTDQVVIYTDSTYVYNSIIKKAGKQANKNGDLWEQMRILVADNPNVQYMWTQGHAGHKWNEYADELCRETYKKAAIPDIGYVQVSGTKQPTNDTKKFLLDRLWPGTSEPYREAYWKSNLNSVQQIVQIMEEYRQQ